MVKRRRPVPREAGVLRFRLSDEIWERLEPFIPKRSPRASSRGGRPPVNPRVVTDAIVFGLLTGCQWKEITLDTHGVSGSTAHRYFQQWSSQGVFKRIWESELRRYEEVA